MNTLSSSCAAETLAESSELTLVLLHGWGMNRGAFSEFSPLLSAHLPVIALDLPGFGSEADTIPDTYELDALVDSVVARLPENCIVAGWSLGGLVAQRLALTYPEKLRGLITIASTPCFVASQCWSGIAPDVLKAFESQLSQNYGRTLERFLAIQAMGSKTAKQDMKIIKANIDQFPAPHPVALTEGLRLLSSVDLRADIGRIRIPTLRLYGRLDSLVPTCGIDRIHELQPGADSVVMPHASHAPFISHPEKTADILVHFAFNLHPEEVCRG